MHILPRLNIGWPSCRLKSPASTAGTAACQDGLGRPGAGLGTPVAIAMDVRRHRLQATVGLGTEAAAGTQDDRRCPERIPAWRQGMLTDRDASCLPLSHDLAALQPNSLGAGMYHLAHYPAVLPLTNSPLQAKPPPPGLASTTGKSCPSFFVRPSLAGRTGTLRIYGGDVATAAEGTQYKGIAVNTTTTAAEVSSGPPLIPAPLPTCRSPLALICREAPTHPLTANATVSGSSFGRR